MSIAQCMCSSFKKEILQGVHAFGTSVVRASTGADTFKIALYTSTATLNEDTTVYSPTNEVANGNGYTTGGATLTLVAPALDGTTAVLGFADVTWPDSTITARAALIYNSSQGNKAVAVLDFGADKSSSSSPFLVTFPSAASTTSILRIA